MTPSKPQPTPIGPDAPRKWAAVRELTALFGIFFIAMAARMACLHQLRDLGFLNHTISDGRVYEDCARAIASGQWACPRGFVHAPLYAYFLAAVRQLAAARGIDADDLLFPRIVQLMLAALSCLLLHRAISRWFSDRVGLIAALMLALYPPAIFFDLLIQKTSLGMFLVVALLWAMTLWRERPTVPRALLCGAIMGLLIHVQQALLLAAPIVPAFLWLGQRAPQTPLIPSRRVGHAAFAITGAAAIALMLAPWVIRNRVVLGEWVLTTPNLGQNFAMGNDPSGRGTYQALRLGRGSGEFEQRDWTRAAERAIGRSLSPSEVSDYYFDQAVERIRANPGDWAKLLARKVLMTLGAAEWMDAEDYYVYTEHSSVLRWLDRFFHFGVLLPLATIGVFLSVHRVRELWPLYLWMLATVVTLVAFVVFGRYRFPMIPVLIGFAAVGVLQLIAHLLRIRPTGVPKLSKQQMLTGFIAAIALALIANLGRAKDRSASATGLANHAAALAATGRLAEAQRDAQRAVKVDPSAADAWLILADIHRRGGKLDEALASVNRAAAVAPGEAAPLRARSAVLIDAGRLDEAEGFYRKALEMDDRDSLARAGLAGVLARTGRAAESISMFEQSLAEEPEMVDGRVNYGNALLELGRFDDAAAAYRAALVINPRHEEALLNLAILEFNRGRAAEALAQLDALARHRALKPPAQMLRLSVLARLGRIDDAREEARALLDREPDRDDVRRMLRALDVAAARATTQPARATTQPAP